MTDTEQGVRSEAVRRFNRFYTQKIGVLEEGLLKSPFSLAEVRVLYEIAHHERPIASVIGKELALDPGYLSRIVRKLEKQGLLEKAPSELDGRQCVLMLTEEGQAAFSDLNARSRREIDALLSHLSPFEQHRLLDAMRTIEALLGEGSASKTPYLLRPHQPGDMGWVVHRHGVLYSKEYGWNDQFEALVAEIAAQFLQGYDPRCERSWIAEKDGEIVGSVLLVKESDTVARLRLLLVEPSARGLGIGRRLVNECVRFARQAHYRKITLWTNDVLHAARRIYEKEGFQLVHEERHNRFGPEMTGQTWEIAL